MTTEIGLGKVELTKRQRKRYREIRLPGVFSFSAYGDEMFVVHERTALTPVEKDQIIEALKALPDDPLPEELADVEYKNHAFFSITPDQAEKYIHDNVTDLPSAKAALKLMARMITHLNRKVSISVR